MNKGRDSGKKFSFNKGDVALTVLSFASMGLTIWAINIYRLTIIELKYLFVAIVFGAITAFAALTLIQSSYSSFWTFFIKAGIGGGIFYFSVLF